MNLNEERNYQKMLDALEGLELSVKNLEIAKKYMDYEAEADDSLLRGLEPVDFSQLDDKKCGKSFEYVAHLKKRRREEESRRYAKLVTAMGGSTAHYIWCRYSYDLRDLFQYVTPVQEAALRAESMVWSIYSFNEHILRPLWELGRKDPQTLREATKLCYHKNSNSKLLLTALYLNCVKGNPGGLKERLFGRGSAEKEAADYLTDALKTEEKRYRQGAISDYLVTLLGTCAFLSVEHAPYFQDFLTFLLQKNWKTTLDVCYKVSPREWFETHAPLLESRLPMSYEEYIQWAIHIKAGSILRRMAKQQPQAVKNAAAQLNTDEYQVLMKEVMTANPALHREIEKNSAADMKVRLARELTAQLSPDGHVAVQYLLGEGEIDSLIPHVMEWRQGYDYYQRGDKIQRLAQSTDQQMYRRVIVLDSMCHKMSYLRNFYGEKHPRVQGRPWPQYMMEQDLRRLVTLWNEEKMPLRYQLEGLGALHDSYYTDDDKAGLLRGAAAVMAERIADENGEDAKTIRTLITSSPAVINVVGRCLCVRAMDVYWQRYRDELFACATDTSKQVREQVAETFAGHRELEGDILTMLKSKKSQEREVAVAVIKQWGAEKYTQALTDALAAEKSKKLKELIGGCLGLAAEAEVSGQTSAGARTPEDVVKELLKGGKKRKVEWAYGAPFNEVRRTDGTAASEDYMKALLVAYADMGIPGASKDAAFLAKYLNGDDLSRFMGTLWDRWIEQKAEAKKKWVLYAASIHGGSAVVPVIYHQIQEWPQHARGAMAAEAVKALALNGSPEALLLVDQTARKFKFRQVKQAAGEALSYAAQELGISREELEDRIVPDLGFGETMERTFDYGPRSFRVVLSPALELEVFNGEGKRLKSLPAPGAKDDPELSRAASDQFKLLKKQLKTVVTNQKSRLEQALSSERLWSADRWKELFVKNPVMHQFAIGLIWGRYEREEAAPGGTDGGKTRLADIFRYMEDGSFNTVDEDEYELSDSALIGLVHPIELSEEELSAWKEQLADYEVVQPVEQLNRPVYRITEEEKAAEELTRFGGKLLNGLSLSGKLQSQGWYRGSVQDAGGYYTFYREDGAMGVELEMSGLFVGDENEEITVYGAKFYKAGTVKRGSYVYDEVKKENTYKLGDVSGRYFSETVLQLTKATASSQEQLPYPECKDNR